MNSPRQWPLEELVRRRESQTLEFKKSLSLQREALETLCAMANSEQACGTVVFGIEPDGNVCGVEPGNLDTAQRSLSQAIRDRFDPKLFVTMEVKELKDKQVLVLSAQRDQGVPYHEYDGRAWV
jgi:ATP-dependent DNA helicase RecG